MEERQLIKLEAWLKTWRISCLKIVAKSLKKLSAWIAIKEQPAWLLKSFSYCQLKQIIT
ncbi:hypothetical protein HDC90_000114 [Pedobacter sp. AK013]|uniref:hypothetical protein n=1 Tax=Pedobacter sp. AK013 TaxID=2723071 RepID=UPI001607F118|nr:hypothetical protein [Pedobacter sp. AK013]MBB6235517.1 hypothetical protein [Pedobacter sp. AK013]